MTLFKSSRREPFLHILYDGFTGTVGGILHVYVGDVSIMIEVPRFWNWHRKRMAGWRGAYR